VGEAKRKRENGHLKGVPVKMPMRKRLAGHRLVLHRRLEETREDGTVMARNIFAVVNDDGQMLAEETPDGPMPILVSSIPQPIRRSVLAASGLVTAR
jgi:hypothetical protein